MTIPNPQPSLATTGPDGVRSVAAREEIQAAIERCNREIAACVAYDGPDKYGVTWAEMDWRTERALLLEQARGGQAA